MQYVCLLSHSSQPSRFFFFKVQALTQSWYSHILEAKENSIYDVNVFPTKDLPWIFLYKYIHWSIVLCFTLMYNLSGTTNQILRLKQVARYFKPILWGWTWHGDLHVENLLWLLLCSIGQHLVVREVRLDREKLWIKCMVRSCFFCYLLPLFRK